MLGRQASHTGRSTVGAQGRFSVAAVPRPVVKATGHRFRAANLPIMAAAAVEVPLKPQPTKPIDGQKTGTSGLRKKTKEFMSPNYLANWVQSLFNALGAEIQKETLALGGDGRYFGKEAAQIIIKLAAGNGFKKVLVGQNAILATPAASAVIRRRKLYGGLIMSASHNPGGPEEDFGIKFNYKSGEPAPESITDKIYAETQKISTLNFADIPDVDLNNVGAHTFNGFTVEVIDSIEDYLAVLKEVFDFPSLKAFVSRKDFSMVFDAMHAVTGPYAKKIFVEELGAAPDSIKNGVPLPDFGGGHPDPNLTYAHDLVELMYGPNAPMLGAASDGDGDRNMVLGPKHFVSPSDSVAMIAANAQASIKYFKDGVKGLARSMPTGGALDRVAAKLGVNFYETPTGWKFFGNLMDAGKCSICGEESFGTGADHIREKDGIFAVLCWLSILAKKNEGKPEGAPLVSIQDVALEFWQEYGRNFFSRYDYENCSSEDANKMVDHVRSVIASSKKGDKFGAFVLEQADDFEYTDPVDGSVAKKQGLRFVFQDGSRIIFRLSGTGASGATIRLYIEQYTNDPARLQEDAQVALKDIIAEALKLSKLQEFTGRDKPTVIT